MKLITKRKRPNPLNTKLFKDILKATIAGESLEEIMELEHSEDTLISLHSSLGRWIRNTFIFGTDFMLDYPDECIDEVSFEIIMNFHKMAHDLRNEGHDLYKISKVEKEN